MNTILKIKKLCKKFGSVEVLKGLDFEVQKGEVHGLLGANGAGKSTLIKIISGVLERTSGEISFRNELLNINSPIAGLEKGISVIHQELSVIPQMTVLDNLFLGREKSKFGFVNRKQMLREYQNVCEKMNFNLAPDALVRTLTVANRQVIEIMKAVSYDTEIIIMDEPTSSLSEHEKQNLFTIISHLKSQGKTIIYISHMLEEIFHICDSASVMFDGQIISTLPVEELTPKIIAELMSGGTVKTVTKSDEIYTGYDNKPVLSVNNLTRGHYFKDVSFELYPGEVLGIAGLVGSGRSEIVRCLFGADIPDGGEMKLDGKPYRPLTPTKAIKNGIGLIPEDRKQQGLVLKHPIYKNADILSLDHCMNMGLLNKKKEVHYAERAKEMLSIVMDNPCNPVSSLSGGNQQKVVVAKWLESDLKVLIFDEPTKGIDVNSKQDIFRTVLNFAQKGVSVIFISSDLEEVITVSNRILILDNGTVKKIVDNNKNITVNNIMNEIFANSTDGMEEVV